MTDDEITKAKAILRKAPNAWTKDETAWLQAHIKKGRRDELKRLRVEASLD